MQKMQTLPKPSLASSTPRLPVLSLEEVFDASRTLQSITVAKNEFESSENILEVPSPTISNGSVEDDTPSSTTRTGQRCTRRTRSVPQFRDGQMHAWRRLPLRPHWRTSQARGRSHRPGKGCAEQPYRVQSRSRQARLMPAQDGMPILARPSRGRQGPQGQG